MVAHWAYRGYSAGEAPGRTVVDSSDNAATIVHRDRCLPTLMDVARVPHGPEQENRYCRDRSSVPRDEVSDFPDVLNQLFATIRPPGERREYTNVEIARATGISAAAIGLMRNGERPNPTRSTMVAIARFFGIAPGILLNPQADTDTTTAQIQLAAAMRHPAVGALAMRALAADVSPEGISVLIDMLDFVAANEGRSRRPADDIPDDR